MRLPIQVREGVQYHPIALIKQKSNRMSKEHLIPFKPGQSGNPNGRPRKYVSLLKEQGYKLAEINDTIQAMMSMDLEELKTVWDNPKATILEKTLSLIHI